jgi:hypothetical protein
VGRFRPTVTVLFGRGSWYAAPPAPADAAAVYCVPCQGITWSAANKWHGFGPTGISGFNWQVRIRSPLAFTLTDIRVELTGALTGGGGSTIAWSIQLNDVTDDQVVATVGVGQSGASGSGELAIAENDLIVIESVRTGTPVASVVTRGLTLGYRVTL